MYGSVYQCLDHSVTTCIQPYNIIIIITVLSLFNGILFHTLKFIIPWVIS